MTAREIVRAWKDVAYRASLTDAQRATLPEHPAGLVELSDAELGGAVGGVEDRTWNRTWCGSCRLFTLECCGGPTVTC